MKSRRVFVLAAVLSLPLAALAQPSGGDFVGEWQGWVPGVGDTRLIVTAVMPNGQVDGRMEFASRSSVHTFGGKADSIALTNYGVVSDAALTIQSAMGGKYELRRNGDELSGSYTRGTTMNVVVSFKKS